jgi:hypothetical protein
MNLDARVGQLNQSHLDARKSQGRPGNKLLESSREVRVRRVKAQEESGEFRGQGSGPGPESQGSGTVRTV